jgi:hypothetical protein
VRPEDRKPFLEVVIGFAELKSKQLSAPALELYWNALQHWSLTDFRMAAQQLVRTCEFMPTPKDFEDLLRAGRVTVGEAWDAVLQHCKGAYRSGAGLDAGGPVDRAVAALGGYRAIAFHDSERLHFLERQFAERFAELEDVIENRETLPFVDARPRINRDGPTRVSEFLPKLERGG